MLRPLLTKRVSDDDIRDIVQDNERDLIARLDDLDLYALQDQAQRAIIMALEDGMADWVVSILEARAIMCKKELDWRKRAQMRGGPSVDKRSWADRVSAVKLDKTIAEVVTMSGVTLKKAGSAYKGLCPFHEEKTPSFACWQDSGKWACFGCGASGDMLDYVGRWRGVNMKIALEILEGR